MSKSSERIPPGWEPITVGDVVQLNYGKALPAKTRDNEGFPVYGSNGIVGRHSTPSILSPALLVGRKGSIGEVHLSDGPCSAIDTTYFTVEFYGQPIRYWYYRLKSLPLADLNRATALPGLNRDDAYALDIELPPVAEQRRIVAKIEALQERSRKAREALAEVKQLLEQFRQSLLAAAFRGDLTADWREQHPDVEPASELLARIRQERREKWEQAELVKYEAKGKKPPKGWHQRYTEPPRVSDDDLPNIPESWMWATLDELTVLITSGSRAWSKYYGKGDGTFIMAQNVRPGWLDFSEGRQLVGPPLNDSDRRRSQVQPGDLLVTIVGANTGDICPVEEELPEHWVCQSVALLRLVFPQMYGIILRYFLHGGGGRLRFEKVIYGQGRPHLGFDDLRAMPVPVPPLKEQSELLRLIADREERIATIENGLTTVGGDLNQLDQSILAKAFRGELVPQDPNDEPASVLLERIRQQREANKNGQPKRKGRAKAPSDINEKQGRLGRSQAVLDILLLLEAWGKPVSIAPLEAALVLMCRSELRKSFLKARRRRKRKPARTSGVLVNGLDRIYDYLVARKVVKRVGRHAYELLDGTKTARATQADRDRAAEAIEALGRLMKVRELDEEQAYHVVAEAIETPYEIGTTI